MSAAEHITPCGAGWHRPSFKTDKGKIVNPPPWSCNRPKGHDGAHRVYDSKTFQVMAELP